VLLCRLKEYYERSDDRLPPMYKRGRVKWFIDLDYDGNLIGNTLVSTSNEDSNRKGKKFVIPHIGRTSGIRPILLVDKAQYVLGVGDDKRTRDCHSAFVELIDDCASANTSEAVQAVANFLHSPDIINIQLPPELKSDDVISFRVGTELPSDDMSVQEFWRDKNQVNTDSKDNILIECQICGQTCVPVSPHPIKIKGIPGGQPSGMAMVSANSKAFESYGLENSLIAPTCQSCAEAYATAANELIKRDDTHVRIGPLIYVFWTRNKVELPVLSLFTSPTPDSEQVKQLILSAQKGRIYDAMDDEAFYASAWSASGARIAVRDWIETTVGTVRHNMARWFEMQRLISAQDGMAQFYGFWTLAASLYRSRDANNQMAPNVPEVLMRVALQGGPVPPWVLFQAVKRNRAEQKVTRPRLALIKMVLVSKNDTREEEYLVGLDTKNLEPAYLCGRLLSELESIQKAAINANTTIVDRFYGSASSAPASVFGHLLRGSQAHLAKLRKEKPGLAVIFQKRLEEIQSGLTSFPKVLTLEQQGLFALGYYHQRVSDRQRKDQVASGKEQPITRRVKDE
jgi:CRISPR-associated protein Csd1